MSTMTRRVAQLEAFLDRALELSGAPGLAAALCDREGPIFAKAVGCRDIESEAPFLLSTPYPAASTCKAINATLIGMLVDAGVLGWDEPVQSYLPEFELSDPVRTKQVTLRDLVLMRTGLPRHDWVWNSQPLSRSELLAGMRLLDLNLGFRERQQYNNLGPTIAGQVAERICNSSWNTLVSERLLRPLGMGESFFPTTEPLQAAKGHRHDEKGRLVRAEWFCADAIGPAGGSLYSTICDMAKWGTFNIDPQAAQVSQLISRETLEEIQRPQIAAGDGYTDATDEARYALGWIVDRHGDEACLTHSGYLHDVNNEVSVYPAHGLSIVSVSNLGPPRFPKFINNAILKIWLGASVPEALREIERAIDAQQRRTVNMKARREGALRTGAATPPYDLADYCGEYSHGAYGPISISQDEDRLCARRPRVFACELVHRSRTRWTMPEGCSPYSDQPHPFDVLNGVSFETDPRGAIQGLEVRLEPLSEPIFFGKESNQARPPST